MLRKMMNMKIIKSIILIGLLTFMVVSNLNAQGVCSITGKVQCNDKDVLVGANVVLRDVNRTQRMFGVSTDVDGSYTLQVEKGKYNLEISYIGYVKFITFVEVDGNVLLPAVILQEDNQLMSEVVVTARTVTFGSNGYIAEISKNPFFREQDLGSILKLTPGTDASINGIKVYGQNVSKVYLNGRELRLSGEQLMNYLGTLEGKNIKRMEVIVASGVEEDIHALGSSVIKITTINSEIGGRLNIANASMIYGDGERYSHAPSVDLDWKLGKRCATYFNGMASTSEIPSGSNTDTHFYHSNIRLFNEQRGYDRMKGFYRVLWGLSYDLNANNLFSFEASYNNRRSDKFSKEITRQIKDVVSETMSEGEIDSRTKLWETNISLMYKHLFSSGGELGVQADRLEKNARIKDYNRFFKVEDSRTSNNDSEDKHLLYTARLDYTHRFRRGDGVFNLGLKYVNVSNNQEMIYTDFLNGQKDDETSFYDVYKYSEEMYAAYVKYSFKVKKFDFMAGLRMEHALLSPYSLVNSERNQDSKHTDWAPELGISYALNKEKGHNISFQYNRSVSRPFFFYLNPRIERINEYSYKSGNPLLGPTLTDHCSLRSTFFNGYILALNYAYTEDGIIERAESADGIIHTIPQCGLKRLNYSAYVGIPVRLSRWGQLNLSVTYDYQKESFEQRSNDASRWEVGVSGLFQFPKGYSMNMNMAYCTPMKFLYGEIRSNMMSFVRINKSLLGQRLNVSVMLADLFNSQGSLTRKLYYENFSESSKSVHNGFNCSINVRYTLHWGNKLNVRRGGSGNAEESARFGSD